MNGDEDAGLSFSAQDRIDLACDRFEAAWKAGDRPRIEDHLAGADSADRGTLLRELLVLELFWRRRAGERPEPVEYARRFPDGDDLAAIVAVFVRHAAAPARFSKPEFLAEGGLGKVFTAHDEELGRVVALKVIRDRRAHDPQSQARFRREAEITGRLEHPGIVAVYSLNHGEDGRPYYAMRLIRGETLKEAVAQYHAQGASAGGAPERSLAFRGLLRRVIDVCNTVAYAHSQGVLHRDLKPENVMLGRYSETMVLDWGLAKPVNSLDDPAEPPLAEASFSDSGETQPGSRIGTPAYMSPEQAAGDPGRIGPASDIYGLGATLYHVLTGRSPFAEERDLAAVLERVQAGAFESPRAVRAEIPRALEAICLKAMARQPEDRYAGAMALAEDLEHWLADEPVTAWREPWRTRSRRWMRRHRTLVTSTAAVFVLGVMGLVGFAAVLAGKNQELNRQRARAEEREGLAIDAVKNFGDAVAHNPDLKERPELEELRKTLLQGPLRFFDRLRDQLQADRDTRPDALVKLAAANALLARTTEEIGSISDAIRSLSEAMAIHERLVRDHPAVALYQRELASSHNNIGRLLSATRPKSEALQSYRRAGAIQERLVRDHPSVALYQQDLASSHNNIGVLLRDTGRPTEALESFRRALAIQELLVRSDPTVIDYQSDLAKTHSNIGTACRATDAPGEALESYRRALQVRERLARDYPSVAKYRQQVALSHFYIGNLLFANGPPTEALEAYRNALAIREKLASDQPTVTLYQSDLATSHNNIGIVLDHLGRSAEALASHRRALEVRERLARDHPAVIQHRIDLAGSLSNVAILLKGVGQFAEALKSHESALEIRERLARDYPNDASYQSGLAASLNNIGTLRRATGAPAEALQSFRKALEICERLARDHPSAHDYQRALGEALDNIAKIEISQGRWREAYDRLNRAIEHQRRALSAMPRHPFYQHDFRLTLFDQVKVLQALNQPVEAVLVTREAAVLARGNPTDMYNVACLLSLSIPLTRSHEQPALAAEAVQTLRAAVAVGWRDARYTARDPDLIPLREHDDFRRVLAELFDRGFPPNPFAR